MWLILMKMYELTFTSSGSIFYFAFFGAVASSHHKGTQLITPFSRGHLYHSRFDSTQRHLGEVECNLGSCVLTTCSSSYILSCSPSQCIVFYWGRKLMYFSQFPSGRLLYGSISFDTQHPLACLPTRHGPGYPSQHS